MGNAVQSSEVAVKVHPIRAPEGIAVQSLILAKATFATKDEANKWITDHEFEIKENAPDEVEDSWRYRQFDPAMCAVDSFTSFEITAGVTAAGCRKTAPADQPTPESEGASSPAESARTPKIEKRAVEAHIRSIDVATRTVTGYATKKVLDRHGTVILPGAYTAKLELFRANPVMLWAHNMFAPPIGTIEEIAVEQDGVRFRARFAKTAFADEIFGLFADGILKAFSIGFYILKQHAPSEQERAEFGADARGIVDEIELLEISAVPVGSNPGALVANAAPGAESNEEREAWKLFGETISALRDLRADKREVVAPAKRGHEALVAALAHAMQTVAMLQEAVASYEGENPADEPMAEPMAEPKADPMAGETAGMMDEVKRLIDSAWGEIAQFPRSDPNKESLTGGSDNER